MPELQVFLWYAPEDTKLAAELSQQLQGESWLKPWSADDLLPGQNWDVESRSKIETAHAVIVCLSKAGLAQEGPIQRQLKYVLDVALEKPIGAIYLIPVCLEALEHEDLPQRLQSLKTVDYFGHQKTEAFRKICASLKLRAEKVHQSQVIAQNYVLDANNNPEDDKLEFQDRKDIVAAIFSQDYKNFALHGPGGIGKTYLLNYMEKVKDLGELDIQWEQWPSGRYVHCVYLDMKTCRDRDAVWKQALHRLTGTSGGRLQALVAEIVRLATSENPISQLLFLFDFGDTENQKMVDWILSSEGPAGEEGLRLRLEPFLTPGALKIKTVIASRLPVKASQIYTVYYAEPTLMKPLPLNSIDAMLQDLAQLRHYPKITSAVAGRITKKVYYLTAGHPKCAKQILIALADDEFVYPVQPAQWQEYFIRCAMPIVRGEVLSHIQNPGIVDSLWKLSVFRRFDRHMLDTLVEHQILLGNPGDTDSSNLHSLLDENYLMDEIDSEMMMKIYFHLRRILSLCLQYSSPQLYQIINTEALNIFIERLHTGQDSAPRVAVSLMEIVYHTAKALQVRQEDQAGLDVEEPATSYGDQLESVLKQYLPLTLKVVPSYNHTDFLRLLYKKWRDDDELRDVISLLTGDGNCYIRLTAQLREFLSQNGVVPH